MCNVLIVKCLRVLKEVKSVDNFFIYLINGNSMYIDYVDINIFVLITYEI